MLCSAACSAPPPLVVGIIADDTSAMGRFAAGYGAEPRLFGWFQAWRGEPAFDAGRAAAARAHGALPVVAWEPWDPTAGVDQPAYSLKSIAAGAHDDYVRSFATQVAREPGQVGVRFLHELNAGYYPWGAGVNGNTAADAVQAWRHVRHVFDALGAVNVVWIWNVNVELSGSVAYQDIYPGDDVVDWLGIDGYNGGTDLPWGGWRAPRDLFGGSVAQLRGLSSKPLLIMETASSEHGGDKAVWIDSLFDYVREQGLEGFMWFDLAKETDWRIASSPRSAEAFRGQMAAADLADSVPSASGEGPSR